MIFWLTLHCIFKTDRISDEDDYNDTKLGDVVNILEERVEIKKDLVWIEQWEEMNRIKFNREVYKFLLLSGKNKKFAYRMGKSDLAIAQGSGCCCQPQIKYGPIL